MVNATSFVWRLIENSMEAAFKVGANYIDLAGSRQLQFNEKWRDADLTASIGAGEDPPIDREAKTTIVFIFQNNFVESGQALSRATTQDLNRSSLIDEFDARNRELRARCRSFKSLLSGESSVYLSP